MADQIICTVELPNGEAAGFEWSVDVERGGECIGHLEVDIVDRDGDTELVWAVRVAQGDDDQNLLGEPIGYVHKVGDGVIAILKALGDTSDFDIVMAYNTPATAEAVLQSLEGHPALAKQKLDAKS